MSVVTVLCTKCGKANDVAYTGYKDQVRCAGCGGLVSVGGREHGLKALPLHEMGLAVGILVPLVFLYALYDFIVVKTDPLYEETEALKTKVSELLDEVADEDWTQLQFADFKPDFNDDFTSARVWVNYTYMVGETVKKVSFPLQLTRVKERTKSGREALVWKIEKVGIFDQEQFRQLLSANEPAGVDHGDDESPIDLRRDWRAYQWCPYNFATFRPLFRGEPFTLPKKPDIE